MHYIWNPNDSLMIVRPRVSTIAHIRIGANGSVRGKKEFEPSSLAAESEPLLGPHLED
eukprot:COSAG02_NODE_52403_length_308_cov_0.665072_1_plen_57_part_01